MKQQEKELPEKLERILADILLPGAYYDDIFEGTSEFELKCGLSFERYLDTIEKFVAARKRNYNSFRDFLDEHSEIYYTRDICNLSNFEIDQLFDKILEYQGDRILEDIGY